MKKLLISILALVGMAVTSSSLHAFKEWPIGREQRMNHMAIAAVYLQAVDMAPRGMDLPASRADIHLEADIHATKGHPSGFGAGEWIPFLRVTYRLTNRSTGKVQSGTFMPMVAADGPHYGSNIKMMGPGNYDLTYTIEPPSRNGFGRHTDKETGVGKWFQPFTVTWKNFKYVPVTSSN